MFRITPIGSCRITTPLRLAREGFGFQLNLDRVYGFCHSSAEAVQMMHYLQGNIDLDPALAPLIARRGRVEDRTPVLHQTSDLYVVELSAAKELRIGQTSVQLNYVISNFSAFFADRSRAARYWDHAEADDQAALDDLLAAEWSATSVQVTEAATLRQIRRRTTPQPDLRRDVRALIDGLPAVLFVSHVDALTSDGLPIPSRERYIEQVEAAVRAEGGLCYNPTAAMTRMGQRNAIEDESDSLAHFTEGFSRVVFQDWFDLTIEDLIDAKARAGTSAEVRRILLPHVTARLAGGEIASLIPRLDRLVQARPDCPESRSLLATTYAAAGQSAGALAALRVIPIPDDPASRSELLLRRFYLALDLADAGELANCLNDPAGQLLSAPPSDLVSAAEILREASQPALALAVLLGLLRTNATLHQGPQAILKILQQDMSLLAKLQPDDVKNLAMLLPSVLALGLLDKVGMPDELLELATTPGRVDAGDLAAFAQEWTDNGRIAAAAALVAAWRSAGRADRIAHPALRRVVDGWHGLAMGMRDRSQRSALLSAVVQADPLHSEARLALRATRRDILADMRMMANAGDLAALQALQPDIAQLEEPIPEYALARMRLMQQTGDYAGAMQVARDLIAEDPDHLIAWTTLMRAAQKTGDLLTLEAAAQAIIARTDDDCRRIEDEARDRLEKNPALCFRMARTETDPLRAHRLFSIAVRNPGFAHAAELRLRRIEANLAAAFSDPDQWAKAPTDALAKGAAALASTNPRLCLSLGRYLFRQQDFAAALPSWEYLTKTAPENPSYALQANRCRARLGQMPSGAAATRIDLGTRAAIEAGPECATSQT